MSRINPRVRYILRDVRFGFDPLSVSGLKAWFDATDATTLFSDSGGTVLAGIDDNVLYWADKSGVANHLNNALGGGPVRKATHCLFASDSMYRNAADMVAITQPAEVYGCGFLTTSPPAVQAGFLSGRATATDWMMRINTGRTTYINAGVTLTGGGAVLWPADSTVHVLHAYYNTTSSQAWIDNTSTGTGNAGTESLDGIVVSGNVNGAVNYWNGGVCELLIYEGTHDATTRTTITNYLITKHG